MIRISLEVSVTMQLTSTARSRLGLPVLLTTIAVAVGCNETVLPEATRDVWADAAVVGLELQSELTLYRNLTPQGSVSRADRVTVPVLRGTEVPLVRSQDDSRRSVKPRTALRHFRDASGTRRTVAVRYDDQGSLPKLIFLFEAGRIRTIVSPSYERFGRGFIRTSTRTTIFAEDGTIAAQVDQKGNRIAAREVSRDRARTLAQAAAKDVIGLFLPKPLYAEESIPCIPEWVSYFAASSALAAANVALTAAAAACPLSAGAACPATVAAFVAWTATLAAWTDKLDKLTTCIANHRTNDAEMTHGSNGGDAWSDFPDWPDEDPETTKTVLEFIDDSIANGNYTCSADGNHCVYYST